MNIILIGYRCSGKTAVGKILAQKLKRQFVDLDEAIEALTGSDIKGLVSRKGWGYFRQIERQMIQTLTRSDNLVLATGGGVVMEPMNVKDLKANGLLVYLEADAKVLTQRMQNDQISGHIRPALTDNADPVKEIEAVLKERTPFYLNAGDFIVNTSDRSPEEVAQTVMNHEKMEPFKQT
ncbi:MAG: shikimate kinase [Desulfobacteraceae bacterium]|nr:MAG: shikimate kinase [Desulfobacteraceae bacterium]